MNNIYQKGPKLIKNIILLAVLLPMMTWAKDTYQISNPKAEKVNVRLAITRFEHSRGLSGIKPSEFPDNEAMLFINESMGARRFWMPDTYFNLDITFLDSNLKVIGIEKDVPMHPGMGEPPAIYRTKTYEAQFVLETKAKTAFARDLKVGDKLRWISKTTISEIVLKTRQQQ